MNLKLDIVRLTNEDVIATSCAWETIKNQNNINIFNSGNMSTDPGKSFKYNGEYSGSLGPAGWPVFGSFYDSNGKLIGTVGVDDTSYLKSGSYYHVGSNGDNDFWVECEDPSHYSD